MEQKFVVVGRKIYTLNRWSDGLYHDLYGCIWALRDDKASADPIDRCGIDPLALPIDHPLNEVCKIHDFQYSSPAYQAFHTRLEADKQLLNNLRLIAKDKWYSIFAKPFYRISRWFGGAFWENKKTR